jgi:hypothetical protein
MEPPLTEDQLNATANLSVRFVNELVRRLEYLEGQTSELGEICRRIEKVELMQKASAGHQGPKIANPEFFKGDRLLLSNFISQCKLKFSGEPGKFSNEKSKIYYAGSYLREGPYSWFQPLLSADSDGETPSEFQSFKAFEDALTTIYGDPNLVITSERELRLLRQTTSVAHYIAEFQRLRQYVKHNEAALIDQFYHGLKDNVKDRLVNGPRSETLAELMKSATTYDARIQERIIERKSASGNLTVPPRSASSSPANLPPTPSRTPTPVTSPAAPRPPPTPTGPRPPSAGPRPDGTVPMIIDGTRTGPVTPAERERRRANNLCFYCASPGHTVFTCPAKPRSRVFSVHPADSYAASEMSVEYEHPQAPLPSTNASTHE